MKIFSVLLASTSKDVILYSWSTPVIFIVIAQVLPRASEGSGYERNILIPHLVLLTLVNAWHHGIGWKGCHKVSAPA